MMHAGVSVVIPVFNTPARWLQELFDSIEAQTFRNFDVVIVNDGSTRQETLTGLERIGKEHRYTIIQRAEHRGIPFSRNEGFRHCRHDLVAVMDHDDIMAAHRLERQIQYMNEHPDVSAFGTRMIVFSENEKGKKQCLGLSIPRPRPIVTREAALTDEAGSVMNHPTVILRKKDVLSIGAYDESLDGYSDDYELFIRMLRNGLILHNTPEPLHYYRLHQNNSSRFFKADNAQFLQRIRHTLKE